MKNKHIIVLCLIAATLCSCKSKTDNTTAEPPASQQQAVQAADDNTQNCGDTACKVSETCLDGLCKPEPEQAAEENRPTSSKPLVPSVADKHHVQCGDKICQYKEVCKDNQCKTEFEMKVFLAPIPKSGTVKNDSYDYWECQSDTCTYQANQTYTISKGLRIREGNVYCGGEGIKLSKMKDHACTSQGWVCVSPNGCGDCEGDCRYNACDEVTCSPGEKCDGGCEFVNDAIDGIKLCETGNCECGENRCGKNQICAYGNCYFAGEIKNGFADCEFESYSDICGTSDTPSLLVRYICPERCPSEVPQKEEDGYFRRTFTLGVCYGIDIGLWICSKDEGCKCGDTHCLKDAACIDGKCALYTAANERAIDDFDTDGNICATEYPDSLSYQPKVSEHYRIDELEDYPETQYWMCDDSNACICNGEKLPAGMICHGEKDGTEYIACRPDGDNYNIERAPKNIANYICKNNQFVCENDNCLCGGKPLPKNAHCKNDTPHCFGKGIPADSTGYACSVEEKKWVCTSEKCLCGGTELRPGIECLHWENDDYQCCGDHRHCFTAQTASEYECNNSKWILKAEDGQHHCKNKPLPAGAECKCNLLSSYHSSDISYREYASCGSEELFEWNDYKCENNTWKCASILKPCMCNGKPLPDGARCIKDKAYCGADSRSNWDGYSCMDGEWVDPKATPKNTNPPETNDKSKDVLCHGHKLAAGVICPGSLETDDTPHYKSFTDDITMSDMESCEHVRGCLCHDKLCPPSGICTEKGCIDPVTDKPFESKDGYLVSDKLMQCANPRGCKCGDKPIEYRDYCYQDEPYISMVSCVSDHKRTIGENNYPTCACEGGYYCAPNYQNECEPDPDIEPSQYLVRDCLKDDQAFFSDRSVSHHPLNVCMQNEGCQCIHNTCKYGEACYKGQCIPDYPCHNVNFEDNEDQIGKCRPAKKSEEDE